MHHLQILRQVFYLHNKTSDITSVAYQLELRDSSNKWVELDSYLYGSLGFGNMLPFIADADDNIYQAIKGNYPIQWSCYCDASQSIKGDANTFSQKIEDYYIKFNYLFDGVYNKNFIINIILQFAPFFIQSVFQMCLPGGLLHLQDLHRCMASMHSAHDVHCCSPQ